MDQEQDHVRPSPAEEKVFQEVLGIDVAPSPPVDRNSPFSNSMLGNQYASDSAVLQSTAGTMSYMLSPNAFVASNRRAGGFDQSKKQQLALHSSHYCTCGARKLMEEELDAKIATLNTEKQIELQRQAESYENDILEYKVMLQRLETKLMTQSFSMSMKSDGSQSKPTADGANQPRESNNKIEQQTENERKLVEKLHKHKSHIKDMLNVIDKANVTISNLKQKFRKDEETYLNKISDLQHQNKAQMEKMLHWQKQKIEQSEKN